MGLALLAAEDSFSMSLGNWQEFVKRRQFLAWQSEKNPTFSQLFFLLRDGFFQSAKSDGFFVHYLVYVVVVHIRT